MGEIQRKYIFCACTHVQKVSAYYRLPYGQRFWKTCVTHIRDNRKFLCTPWHGLLLGKNEKPVASHVKARADILYAIYWTHWDGSYMYISFEIRIWAVTSINDMYLHQICIIVVEMI